MILMSVDLPAPFSPTRAWISPPLSSSETVVQGLHAGEGLADAHGLERDRVSQLVGHLSVLCGHARPGGHVAGIDGTEDEQPEQQLHVDGVDTEVHERVVDDGDDERRKDEADDAHRSSGQRHAADDGHGEGDQQPGLADLGLSCAQLRGPEHARTRPPAVRR